MDTTAVVAIALGTFTVALFNAIIGPTGGFQLAIVVYFLPPQLAIPVHSVISFVPAIYRTITLRRHIDWRQFTRFAVPSGIGTGISAALFVQVDEGILLAFIGLFILSNNYIPYKKIIPQRATRMMDSVVGLVTGLLTVFVGATGPAIFTYIAATKPKRLEVMGTDGACTSFQHVCKMLVFSVIAPSLVGYWQELILFAISGILGTRIGLLFLGKLPEKAFRVGFKISTTMIALYLTITGLRKAFGF